MVKNSHIDALILCGASKIAAKSYLFYQSNVLRINMQRVDKNKKPLKRFEDELSNFSQTLIAAKREYTEYFTDQNPVIETSDLSAG